MHNIRLLYSLSDLNKKMFLYFNSTTQRSPNKIFKTFLIEDFLHLPPVSVWVKHRELRIPPRMFEKFRNSPNWILRGLGETDQ
jgi:hypothetical protein